MHLTTHSVGWLEMQPPATSLAFRIETMLQPTTNQSIGSRRQRKALLTQPPLFQWAIIC